MEMPCLVWIRNYVKRDLNGKKFNFKLSLGVETTKRRNEGKFLTLKIIVNTWSVLKSQKLKITFIRLMAENNIIINSSTRPSHMAGKKSKLCRFGQSFHKIIIVTLH